MAHHMLPPRFDGLNISQAASFIDGYSDVVAAYKKEYETDAITLAKFKLSLTGQARDWFETQEFDTWEACKAAFRKQYKSKPSIVAALSSYNSISYDHLEGPRIFFSKLKSAARDAEIASTKMDFFRKLPPEFQKDIIQAKCLQDEDKMLETVETSWEASKVFQSQNTVTFQDTACSVGKGDSKYKLPEDFENFLSDKIKHLTVHSAQNMRRRDPTPHYPKDSERRRSRSRSVDRSRPRKSYTSRRDYSRSHSRSKSREGRDRSRGRSNNRSEDRSRSRSKNRIHCEACKGKGHEWNTCYKLKKLIQKGKLTKELQNFQ